MTNEELLEAADAVHALAEKYGVAFFVSRDQEVEIASTVIKAYLKARGDRDK